MSSQKRPRFNTTGKLVASSNIIRVALLKRFDVIARYDQGLFNIKHSTLTFRTNG